MNTIHMPYQRGSAPGDNDDFKYVLTTFMFSPMEWIAQVGRRPLTRLERVGWFNFWLKVGEGMGIEGLPSRLQSYECEEEEEGEGGVQHVPSEVVRAFDEGDEEVLAQLSPYEHMEMFKVYYEERYFKYHDDNRAIGEYTVKLFCSWLPGCLTPLVKPAVYALVDPKIAECFGFAQYPRLRALLLGGLRWRSRLLHWLSMPRTKPVLKTLASKHNSMPFMIAVCGYYQTFPGGCPMNLDVVGSGRAKRE